MYPVLLAAIDTLVSFFSPHGTWGSFAHTQMDALPVPRYPPELLESLPLRAVED